ncbi:DegT/DnrJ/EryC1/StrS family aminotransferase [Yinghuangia sp. YIM S10712]|uniref:DegT/DnrJ/EryC1/StrS family aminotransferase n=1 Tax=Yinghuangia sp. YIM S10712 TaxID=3436930 RepID=UPI003F52EE72
MADGPEAPGAVPLGRPSLGDAELAAVAEVFRSGWVAGAGPACRAFEEEFAAACGAGHAVAVANCTAALHLALLAYGVGPGDEVIVADYTFPATGHAVLFTGATPVFADVRADTATVDPAAVAALVGPRTVGVIAVDTAGLPADYAELGELTERHGVFLVEDAACAAGATYQGRPAGSLAPVAAFSFHGRKGITCGEGGALVTDDAAIADKARKLAAFGLESAWTRAGRTELPVPVFDEPGYNYKLSDLAAAIMRVQLARLPELLARRREVAAGYAALLADVDGAALPREPADRTGSWQSYAVTLAPGVDRARVATLLREQDIGCNFGTYASHLQPVYGPREACPVSAGLFHRQLAVPMHAEMSDTDVERVAEALRKAVENSR